MKKLIQLVLMAVFVVSSFLVGNSTASAAPGENQIAFYTGKNFTGTEYIYKKGDAVDLYREAPNLNDAFQSVKITPGLKVAVWVDDAFHGYSELYSQDQASIISGLSSFVVAPSSAPTVAFYTQSNFGGQKYEYREGDLVDLYREFPNLNDSFKSVKVGSGLKVSVWRDDAFHGYGELYTKDVSSIDVGGLSSFFVIPRS
jgi:hypothetical protein